MGNRKRVHDRVEPCGSSASSQALRQPEGRTAPAKSARRRCHSLRPAWPRSRAAYKIPIPSSNPRWQRVRWELRRDGEKKRSSISLRAPYVKCMPRSFPIRSAYRGDLSPWSARSHATAPKCPRWQHIAPLACARSSGSARHFVVGPSFVCVRRDRPSGCPGSCTLTERPHSQVTDCKERMGGRAVECTGLEIRQGRKSFVGSNPTPSAMKRKYTAPVT